MPLPVKTRSMRGLLVLARSSHGPRRLPASASGLGSVHGPNTGPLSSFGFRGEMGHGSPSSPDLTCCWGGLPGLTRGTGAAARGRFGGPDSGGGFPAGNGARQAARRARRTAERRAAALGRRLLGGSTEWEAREYRLGSLPTKREWSCSRRSGSKMWGGSRCAAYWRPFLAPSVVRREASVWVSVSGALMPSSHAQFGLAVPNLPLTSGTTQAIVMLHAGAPPCRSGRQVP